MSNTANLEKMFRGPAGWAIVLGVAAIVVYALWDKIGGLINTVASDAGGIISGNNALTAGTEYAGTGVLGTVGAGIDSATGGATSSIGDSIGDALFNLGNSGSAGAAAVVNGGIAPGYTGYSFSTSLKRWTQVADATGTIWNVDANGNITGAA